jgi:hypothetical protein
MIDCSRAWANMSIEAMTGRVGADAWPARYD